MKQPLALLRHTTRAGLSVTSTAPSVVLPVTFMVLVPEVWLPQLTEPLIAVMTPIPLRRRCGRLISMNRSKGRTFLVASKPLVPLPANLVG